MVMQAERFETFVLLIDAIHKSINKVKNEITADFGIKSVHTMWLYELLIHPKGLTATELAAKSRIDRSLVSREIRELERGGYIVSDSESGKRSYNSRITLTEQGKILARKISEAAYTVQQSVSKDISLEELTSFYTVLEKIHGNLKNEISAQDADNKSKE